MASSPQDLYARHLITHRGYPLWTPEPNMSLPDVYVMEGLKIGDVGVVVPEDGSFDVFFNICLSACHSLHRETGVPNNFNPIQLNARDIAKFPEAESPGRIISTSSVERVRYVDTPDVDKERHALNYKFTLSSQEGAVLILPEGAERYCLRNECLFMDEAIRHAVDWYIFAEQSLGRVINHDSLYLITGFDKACSWSLAAHRRDTSAGSTEARFKAAQIGRGNIAVDYAWKATRAMDWRVGPSDQYYYGVANQTVFIQGFKIAIREGILGKKQVDVRADVPSIPACRAGSSNHSAANPQAPEGTDTSSSAGVFVSSPPADEINETREDITTQRFSQVAKPFHPSDVINKYLLREKPSADIAVTHDNQWITLLREGSLGPEELSQEDRLVDVISMYDIALTQGVVYLDSGIEGLEHHGQPSDVCPQTEDSVPFAPRSDQGTVQEQAETPFVYHKNSGSINEAKNVVLFGETGSGRSSIINLMAGREVAEVSPGLAGCTLVATDYHFTLPTSNMSLRVFDTAGLGEPEPSLFVGAIQKAYELIKALRDTGGVHLLLFCIRGGRITDSVVRNYRLFFEFLCNKKVPVALVVTGLENERDSMDNWWHRNAKILKEYGISVVGHACITTHGCEKKRAQSLNALLDTFVRTLASKPAVHKSSFTMDVQGWVGSFAGNLLTSLPVNTTQDKKILAQLRDRCGLNWGQAQAILDIINKGEFDENE